MSRRAVVVKLGSSTLVDARGRARRRVFSLVAGDIAELCGTTQSAIARLERGGRPPRIDTLLRIAEALDCELVVELVPRES